MPDRIPLAPHDDHRDAAERAVAALAVGGAVGLRLAAEPAVLVAAVAPARLTQIAGPPSTAERPPPTLLLPHPAALLDWVESLPVVGGRLADRVWPGPVRLRLPASNAGLLACLPPEVRAILVDAAGCLTVEVPDEPIARAILGLAAGPIVRFDRTEADWLALDASDALALTLHRDPPDPPRPATVVQLDASGAWAVIQPGVVPERTITELAGTILLFVCTGNTCRSPMAAALCRHLLAQRLGCAVSDLAARGFTIESAGVAASVGALASTHALTVVDESCAQRGLDPAEAGLRAHRSQPATVDLVRRADLILAMTWDHLDALVDRFPEAIDRVRLLDPSGDDIPDPFGADEATYRATARVMTQHLDDLLAPVLGSRAAPDGAAL